MAFCAQWNINLATPGYPKPNVQAKTSNKVVISCLKKKLKQRKGRCTEELPLVLWSDRTTPKTSTSKTPYSLVYGCEAVIPAEIHVPTSICSLNTIEENKPLMQDSLTLAEELRDAARIRIASYQQTVARSYNKNVHIRVFRERGHSPTKHFSKYKRQDRRQTCPCMGRALLLDSLISY
ncbi:uncharacterized protein LOC141653937 [Silene latifolia]|uniref:uncharacterized protein LOC141653937 n=1 Tax=Silene latifolia TaxID=37657 RepID=UPI003D776554